MVFDGNQRPSVCVVPGQSWADIRASVARAEGGGPRGLWEGLLALWPCCLQPSLALRGSGEGIGPMREMDWGLGMHQFSMGLPRWLNNKESTCQCRRVRSLGRGRSPEEEMATHSSILAWRIPWTEEPGGLQSMRSKRVSCD